MGESIVARVEERGINGSPIRFDRPEALKSCCEPGPGMEPDEAGGPEEHK
jgi:hypothetical protein